MTHWKLALELDAQRNIVGGCEKTLCDAIRRGADLRIYTEFIFNEHIDVNSPNNARVREVSEFGVTYLIDDRWAAGIMSLRPPVSLPDAFGPRPSMSFFLYNQNGQQAIARPYLDGVTADAEPFDIPEAMRKYHRQDSFDAQTNAPSQNFIYDFEMYRFYVADEWTEVLAHDDSGEIINGSLQDLAETFSQGRDIKVGVRNLCRDLGDASTDHEIFVQTGSGYYTEDTEFLAGSHPLIRAQPAIPMKYGSKNWDFGWLLLRIDGEVVYRRCDPYTLKFEDRKSRCAVRWFAR